MHLEVWHIFFCFFFQRKLLLRNAIIWGTWYKYHILKTKVLY